MKIQTLIDQNPSQDPAFAPFDEVQKVLAGFSTDHASAQFCAGVLISKILKIAKNDIASAEAMIDQLTDEWLVVVARGAMHEFVMGGGE